jgi:MFS family permease
VAAVLLGAFAVIETRVASSPLVPFSIFRSRWVSGANAVMVLVGGAFFSMWYFLSLYMQNVLGYGALRAGIAFVPMAVCIILGAQVSSRLIPRVGVRPLLVAGTVLATAGFIGLTQIGPHSSYWTHVLAPACAVSLALGLLFTPLASAATTGVRRTEAGLASGALNTARQLGGSIGLAVLATIAILHTRAALAAGHPGGGAAALTAGYARAFLVAAGLCLLALAASFIVPSARPATSAVPAGSARSATEDRGAVAEGPPSQAPPRAAPGVEPAFDPDPA